MSLLASIPRSYTGCTGSRIPHEYVPLLEGLQSLRSLEIAGDRQLVKKTGTGTWKVLNPSREVVQYQGVYPEQESAYRDEVARLTAWYNLLLNTFKNKEIVVDFRKLTLNHFTSIGMAWRWCQTSASWEFMSRRACPGV